MICPYCGNAKMRKNGKRPDGRQKYECGYCNRHFTQNQNKRIVAEPACRNPSVTNCLNCTRPDCNCADNIPWHESEIIAEIYAGVLKSNALAFHHRMVKRRKAGSVP